MKAKLFLFFIYLLISFSSISQEIDSLKMVVKNGKNDTNTVITLNNLSWKLRYIGEYDTAKFYLKRAKQLASVLKYKKGEAKAITILGIILTDQGSFNEALSCHFEALALREKIKDKKGIAASYNNIGNIYENQGKLPEALDVHIKALKLREEINDKNDIAASYNNIGNIYNDMKNPDEALKNFLASVKVRKEIGDSIGMALSYGNMGLIYEGRKQHEEALKYYNLSLTIEMQNGYKLGMGDCYSNIGEVYQHQAVEAKKLNKENAVKPLFEKSLEYYFLSLKIREEIGDKQGISTSLSNIGAVYLNMKKYKEAEEYSLRAMKIQKEIGSLELYQNTCENLSQIYALQGKHKESLEMYKEYIFARDSLFNEENTKKTVQLQMQYEFDKKEEITKLSQQKKDELAKEEKRVQQIITWSVVSGLGIVLVFSIFIFRSLQKNKKANKIITLQKIEVEKQKEIVEHQKELVEEHQKEILDSINYAKRIQYTLLAHADFLNTHLPEHFVFFNPKDIVSGDFYWATEKDNKFYIAVCDSTGHGVPGAFMSLLNIGFLSEAINEKDILEPNKVFNYVRERLTNSISKEGQKDGFDGILVCFDKTTNNITFAAANNAPILVRNGELIDLDADKMPVGVGERKQDFTLHTLDYKKDDILYLYTDGYADQFGGPKGKKFKYKPLNEMIVANSTKSLQEQNNTLQQTFNSWKGDLEQVDDVLIIGIKF